jgi:hypothetical protein
VAKYIDGLMRGSGGKGRGEEELETTLDAALVLFRYIQVGRAVVWVGGCVWERWG